MPDRDWMVKAACRGHNPENWFPEDLPRSPKLRAKAVETATRVCESCPVRDECNAYADALDTASGIWGGTRRNARVIPPTIRRSCGTPAGYLGHRRRREAACDPCKSAIREVSRTQRARLKGCS